MNPETLKLVELQNQNFWAKFATEQMLLSSAMSRSMQAFSDFAYSMPPAKNDPEHIKEIDNLLNPPKYEPIYRNRLEEVE